MKIVVWVALSLATVVAVAVLVVYVAGSLMPREHRSRVTATIRAGRAAVWAAISDYGAMPGWWPAVKAVRIERLPDGTELTWNRDAHGQEIPFRTVEARLNEKLVREITGKNLPFGGTWTFELAEAPGGATELTLTEDGWIQPPLFRAVAKWFIGLDATQRDFIASLQKHLSGGAR